MSRKECIYEIVVDTVIVIFMIYIIPCYMVLNSTSNTSVNYIHIYFFKMNKIIILITKNVPISKSSDLQRRKVKKAIGKAK